MMVDCLGTEVPEKAVVADSASVGGDAVRVEKQPLPPRAVSRLGAPGGDGEPRRPGNGRENRPLYRNLKDWVSIDDLDLEVHFVKEGVVLSADSRSSEKSMQRNQGPHPTGSLAHLWQSCSRATRRAC